MVTTLTATNAKLAIQLEANHDYIKTLKEEVVAQDQSDMEMTTYGEVYQQCFWHGIIPFW
jgi:hypothetical protein